MLFLLRNSGFFLRLFLVAGIITVSVGLFAQQAPVVDSFTSSAPAVLPGGIVDLSVLAHDPDCAGTCSSGCGLTIRADLTMWTADGGLFQNIDNGIEGSPYSATAQWQAPMIEATYTITVSLSDSGTFMCGGRQTTTDSITILVTSNPNTPPVVDSLLSDRDKLLVGEIANLTCSASDPEGDPITYDWSTDIGTVIGAGAAATFTAPDSPGIATVTCTVTDSNGAFTAASLQISVSSVQPEKRIFASLVTPMRLGVDSNGYAYVSDRRNGGIVVISIASSSVSKLLPVADITGIAVDWEDNLVVSTVFGAKILDRNGSFVMDFNPNNGLIQATDVAVDTANQRYLVLYGKAGRIVSFDSSGSVLTSFGSNGDGTGQFKGARGLAVDSTGKIYAGDRGHGQVHVFDATGSYLSSFGDRGGSIGEFGQLEDIAIDSSDAIFVSDSYQSRIQVFNSDGSLREVVGEYGDELGQFKTPTGVAVSGVLNKLLVASHNTSSIQVFNMPGAINPPGNTAPTSPTMLSPSDGALIPRGSTVLLEAGNAYDPDYQFLQYEFELYENKNGSLILLNTYLQPEGDPTTSVDATAFADKAGEYVWRVRAFDSFAYSSWTTMRTFTVDNGVVNRLPGIPVPLSPAAGVEITTLEPLLVAQNTTDQDGDPLTYIFEVVLHDGDLLQSVLLSPDVAEGTNTTEWQVPAGVLGFSQEIFWRVRAYDGFGYGEWSGYESFLTLPIPIPDEGEYGNIPESDTTRPGSVRYELGPTSSDTTLYFQLYDITADGEVDLEVNGIHLHTIGAQIGDDWSFTTSVTIPSSELDGLNPNSFVFLHAGTDAWGVRKISLDPAPIPPLTATAYNTVIDLSWRSGAALEPGTEVVLYRSFYLDGPYSKIGTYSPERDLLRDTGLMNGTAYYYRAVYLFPDGSESVPSPVVNGVPTDEFGPTPITDLRVIKVGNDAKLYWTPVTSSPSIDRYEIYSDGYGAWSLDTTNFTNMIGTVNPFSGDYFDSGALITEGDWWYEVIPLDTAGGRAVQ